MNLFAAIRAGIEAMGPIPVPDAASQGARRAFTIRALAGGRATFDKPTDVFGTLRVVIPPPDAESAWRMENLDAKTLQRYSPAKLMELLADLSPEVSRALWDFLRLCNPGYEANALRTGSEAVDKRAQAALDAFIDQLNDLYGSFDVVLGRLFTGAFLRGAFVAELVLDQRGRVPVDLVTPDPAALRFRKRQDPVRGTVYQLCQYQGAELVDLDRETIRYIPVDPFPGSPYGRPLVSAALFSALFLLAMLHDLRRVVQQQGYPRLDISVDLEALVGEMPDIEDEPAFAAWTEAAQKVVAGIIEQYGSLEPDDAYVHSTGITVNRPVGAVDSSSLGAVTGLIEALERMCVRALKTMPLLMSLAEGTSEANANRQWEIHAAGIKALQHLAETLLERLFGIGLQVQGIQATVRFRFAELRVAELLRDEQVQALKNRNAREAYNNGWINQDEAAAYALGKEKADQQVPRTGGGTGGTGQVGGLVGGQPDPGSERLLKELRATRETVGLAMLGARRNGHVEGVEG